MGQIGGRKIKDDEGDLFPQENDRAVATGMDSGGAGGDPALRADPAQSSRTRRRVGGGGESARAGGAPERQTHFHLAFPAFLGTDFAYAARVQLIREPGLNLLLATAAWLPVVVGAIVFLRRFPLPSAGLLWSFAALLPVLHFFPIGVLMAERLTYLPSAGFCIAAAALIGSSRRSPIIVVAVCILVAALGIRSAIRTAEWRSDLALWESELPKAPNDVVVNNNLAVAYFSREEYRKAIPVLQNAIRVAPGYWRAHVNMGITEQGLGDREKASGAYLQAIRMAPGVSSPLFFYSRFQAEEGDLAGAAATLHRRAANRAGGGAARHCSGAAPRQARADRRGPDGLPGGARDRPGRRRSPPQPAAALSSVPP
ncbi:MAG: tetratricopeptide repeat protein [Pseudomonadota bacterium]